MSCLAEHIVIVDDDEALRKRLAAVLGREGFRVSTAGHAAAAREIVRCEPVDLALVDVGMPGESGLSLTRFLRERAAIGVIILSGKCTPVDRVVGLEVGADDYLAKPFHLRELVARVRSVLRRTRPAAAAAPPPVSSVVRFAGWRLDLAARTLTSARRRPVHLTAAELQLLSALVAQPNQVIGRDELLAVVAARRWNPDDRTVDQLVSRLRRKIEKDPEKPQLIQSVRGRGYVLTAPVERGP
jgi:two-component system, OmpR family, response regulator